MSDQAIHAETEGLTDDWAKALEEQAQTEGGAAVAVGGAQPGGKDYAQAKLENLESEPVSGTSHENLDSILEIPVTLSMEIGQTRINIRNLLQLNQGSVVELDRLAGEPLDVLVNGTLVAHGEVVMVNEKFGIRVTDVVSAQERIKKLR
ncbi:MAG: flagellar motor switch protein FliN [Gammaproteobacteria bacterium]|jgi:flagellar motor switch protein FliN/FliY